MQRAPRQRYLQDFCINVGWIRDWRRACHAKGPSKVYALQSAYLALRGSCSSPFSELYRPRKLDSVAHMSADIQRTMFETYRLHAELAERLASLREDVNKLHSGMVTGVVAATVIINRLTPQQGNSPELAWVMPVLGIVVSLSWVMSFLSMNAKLTAKNDVLVALEEHIPFEFFQKEKCAYFGGNRLKKFFTRKYIALIMPVLFAGLCLVILLC